MLPVYKRESFIEANRADATFFQWILSKGTNYTCYVEYMSSLDEEGAINNRIEIIRTIIYALHKPLQFTFFYWTLLILILYKFNFKNRIVKIITFHFIFRSLGDIIDKLGGLMPRYYANTIISQDEYGVTLGCNFNFIPVPEVHPLKWFFTRQIGCIFWMVGEIIADWYPLIRTREIVKSAESIWYVYLTCGIFNLSKLSLIICHFFLSPKMLYDENGVYKKQYVSLFYFKYWVIQLIIIFASIIYDISVFLVLKRHAFQISISQLSFVKKFKTFSEYRIIVTMIITIIFLPIASIAIILKFYYYFKDGYTELEFSFDEIRRSIANLQYFIIFIDQILLSFSQPLTSSDNDSSNYYYSTTKDTYSKNNKSQLFASLSNDNINYNNFNNNTTTTTNNNNMNLLEYNNFNQNFSSRNYGNYKLEE